MLDWTSECVLIAEVERNTTLVHACVFETLKILVKRIAELEAKVNELEQRSNIK